MLREVLLSARQPSAWAVGSDDVDYEGLDAALLLSVSMQRRFHSPGTSGTAGCRARLPASRRLLRDPERFFSQWWMGGTSTATGYLPQRGAQWDEAVAGTEKARTSSSGSASAGHTLLQVEEWGVPSTTGSFMARAFSL